MLLWTRANTVGGPQASAVNVISADQTLPVLKLVSLVNAQHHPNATPSVSSSPLANQPERNRRNSITAVGIEPTRGFPPADFKASASMRRPAKSAELTEQLAECRVIADRLEVGVGFEADHIGPAALFAPAQAIDG